MKRNTFALIILINHEELVKSLASLECWETLGEMSQCLLERRRLSVSQFQRVHRFQRVYGKESCDFMDYPLWKEALRTKTLLEKPAMIQNRENIVQNLETSERGELLRELLFLKGHVEETERRFKMAVD